MPQYITPKEVAKMLGWSKMTVLQKCKSGALPAKKIGTGKWIINFEELKKILP